MAERKKGLELLRESFPENQISKLPKGTKAQNECPTSEKINCKICGGFHHPKVIHLDYVGHAALTDRLLDADPLWSWEPFALKDGLPAFDNSGGLWIKLTVCGHTRIGYGHAAASSFKDIGAREKEVIGDALRNAAMRFGAALDLWHKGELHVEDEEGHKEATKAVSANLSEGKTLGEEQTGEQKAQASESSPVGDRVILYIEEIEKKEGVNAKTKKPWTSWTLKVGNSKWGTFSGSVAALAEEAKAAGKPVEVSYIIKEFAPGKYSNEIVNLKILDEA